jgi:hypothetical protein
MDCDKQESLFVAQNLPTPSGARPTLPKQNDDCQRVTAAIWCSDDRHLSSLRYHRHDSDVIHDFTVLFAGRTAPCRTHILLMTVTMVTMTGSGTHSHSHSQ